MTALSKSERNAHSLAHPGLSLKASHEHVRYRAGQPASAVPISRRPAPHEVPRPADAPSFKNAPSEWDAAALRHLVRTRLGATQIIVVSNRQPHSHVWRQGAIQVEQTPSGLVTAIEPMVRACGGLHQARGV